mgnify:CR=1 FL=1|tara:strand:- start:22302 stop:23135 length:834 start_codon:yes stop_codon:yes gene_type:complete
MTGIRLTARYALVLLIILACVGPLLWVFVSSIKPADEIFADDISWWVPNPTLEHYAWVLNPASFRLLDLLSNTLIVCATTALLTAVFAAACGYALSRYPGLVTTLVVGLLLLAQLVQGPMIMLPWYQVASGLDLLDTKQVLVAIYLTMTVPVGVLIMRGFFDVIPTELEEAASMDGAGRFRTLTRIILPLVTPGLVAIATYSFILAWNDYQYALILTSSYEAKTVQVGIAELLGSLGATNWGGILAASVIVVLPVVVVFAFAQRALIEGLTAGGVKG